MAPRLVGAGLGRTGTHSLKVALPPPGRLGLCRALGVPVPDEPFPLTNTTEEFLARFVEPD